jgi:molecular chaperone DnaJ
MSILNSKGRGDMIIDIRVETPVNLTKDQQAKLKEFQTSLTAGKKGSAKSTSPESEGFFARAKELWEDLTD